MKSQPGATARREEALRQRALPRLILLRHGEPDWTPDEGATVSDPGLTPFGREQAEAAARAVAEAGIDAVYVSPYRRAQETAEPLVKATGLDAVTVDDLAEIGIAFEGLTQTEVDETFVEAAKRPLEEHWDGWPGGETFTHFHARVTRGILDVLGRHGFTPRKASDFTIWDRPEDAAPQIAIVAHGGTNAVLLTHLLDVRPVPWEWLRFESALCAYSVLQARPLGGQGLVWSLQNFNEIDHLRAAKLLA